MTFPKLVVHAALAGLYGGLIVALFLRLANPAVGAAGGGQAPTLLLVVLAYTLAAAVVWPVLYVALRFFARHRLRLTWLSLRYLIGFHAVNTSLILGSGWLILSKFRATLAPPEADRLAAACGWLTVAWLAAATVATVPRLRRRVHLQAAAGGLALVALLVSLHGDSARSDGAFVTGALSEHATETASRPAGAPPTGPSPAEARPALTTAPPARRLVLLNFDGADLDTILTMQAQGKLPAFSRLVQEGTYGRLASILPCVASVTRATLVTGMLPYRNGVRSAQARSVLGGDPWIDVVPPGIGFDVVLAPVLERRATRVSDRQVPTFWEISARLGGLGEAAGWDDDQDAVRPAAASRAAPAAPQDWIADLLDPEVQRQKEPAARALVAEVARAAAADALVLDALQRLEEHAGRGVTAASFPGLDRVAHIFLRYARPADFGNVSPRDVDLYGAILERYYRRIDGIVGRALQSEGAGALLMVSATHGIRPAPPLHRLKDEILGGEHLSGIHEDAPPGFLFVHGRDALRGRVFGKGSIADVAPTVLYALGLPVARDAHGGILARVFSEAFTATHPVTVIGSYDTDR